MYDLQNCLMKYSDLESCFAKEREIFLKMEPTSHTRKVGMFLLAEPWTQTSTYKIVKFYTC